MKEITSITITLFSICQLFAQQFDNVDFLEKEVDSVFISTIDFQDKTTANIKSKKDSISGLWNPADDEIKEKISVIKRARLSEKETSELTSLIQKPEKGHALPYHYDIQLDFYKNGTIIQMATISSITKNLVVRKEDCKTSVNEYKQEIDPCFFMGMVSNRLKRYVVHLLKNKKLWDKNKDFLEGIN